MKLSKILALVMALVMVFAFAACSKAPAAETPTEAPSTEAPAAPADEPAAPEGAPELSDCTGKFEFAAFSFKVNDVEINNDLMKDATMWKVKDLETVNSKGNASVSTYSGYAIKDVLAAAGCPDATKLILTCNDGYEIEFTIDDTNAPYCLVAIEKDKELAEEGVFFAPCLEETSSNYAKNVVSITAE